MLPSHRETILIQLASSSQLINHFLPRERRYADAERQMSRDKSGPYEKDAMNRLLTASRGRWICAGET